MKRIESGSKSCHSLYTSRQAGVLYIYMAKTILMGWAFTLLWILVGVAASQLGTWIVNSGKVKLHQSNLIVYYKTHNNQDMLVSMMLEFDFTNTSNYDRLITDIQAIFCYGRGQMYMQAEGHTMLPAAIIGKQNITKFKYTLLHPLGIIKVPDEVETGESYILVRYKMKNSYKDFRIDVSTDDFVDVTQRISFA